MSRSTAITIIVATLILIGGGLAWWYFSLQNESSSSTEESGGGIDFFPFGNNGGGVGDQNSGGGNQNQGGQNQNEQQVGNVREISSSPVSGFIPLVDNLGFPFARYVDQETGNIYDAPLEIVSKKRMSNTTIPKVREVLWLPGGNSLLMRYLDKKDSIQTFSASIKENSSGEGSLVGKFLSEGISNITLLPTSNSPKIVYGLSEGATFSLFSAENDGSKPTKLYSSPLKDWLVYTVNENLIYLQTKSSGKASSYLFSLNPKTGVTNQIISNTVGLSVLPNKKGDFILYSETKFGYPILHIYDVVKKTSLSASVKTFADKCRWSDTVSTKVICAVPSNMAPGTYPDDWYQGKTSFNDDIWEIDSSNGNGREVFGLYKNSYFFDIANFSLSDKDKYMILQNKNNNSLWSVRLEK